MKKETKEELEELKYYLVGRLDGKIDKIEKKIDVLSDLVNDAINNFERESIEAKLMKHKYFQQCVSL